MSRIYINLIVSDLAASTAFYQALGFVKNEQFSDEKASGMNYDEHLTIMLLSKPFAQEFLGDKKIADTHSTCAILNALQFDSRVQVDEFFNKAIAAGGKEMKQYDYGFMYGKDFEDIDGHIREPFWMDMSQMPTNQTQTAH